MLSNRNCSATIKHESVREQQSMKVLWDDEASNCVSTKKHRDKLSTVEVIPILKKNIFNTYLSLPVYVSKFEMHRAGRVEVLRAQSEIPSIPILFEFIKNNIENNENLKLDYSLLFTDYVSL